MASNMCEAATEGSAAVTNSRMNTARPEVDIINLASSAGSPESADYSP
jgi:hypothetical protein